MPIPDDSIHLLLYHLLLITDFIGLLIPSQTTSDPNARTLRVFFFSPKAEEVLASRTVI